jgi:hypothetical protein
MNKIITLLIFTFLLVSVLPAQKYQFGGMAAYNIGGILEETEQAEGVFTYGNALGVSASEAFGLYFNVQLLQKMRLEVSWDRQLSQLNFHAADSASPNIDNRVISKLSDINIDYFLVGLVYDWSQGNYQPFIGASIGMARFTPDGDFNAESRPGLATVLGVNMFMSSYFAFRAQTKFMVTHMPEGVFFQNSAGEGFHPEKDTFMIQYQFGLGFVINL